jgi:anti-sigma regulatory factor (Ser/Thr protein kinase)
MPGAGEGTRLRHEAVFYRSPAECRSAVRRFVLDGVAAGEPVMVALPGEAGRTVLDGLDGQAEVAFADMRRLGRNPGRIMPAIWDFVDGHGGRPVRFAGESAWPGRSAAEIREAATHEAMINLAFAAMPLTVLCPYDVSRLPPRVTGWAARTHPVTQSACGRTASEQYAAGSIPGLTLPALRRPPEHAERLSYSTDLRPVRQAVARFGDLASLPPDRLADLIIAVGEVAANTLRHTAAGGTLYLWRTSKEVICQVSDAGQIRDPLAGRRRPAGQGGLGLWVVHQVCDLVQLRTGASGTTIRMHMRLAG